MEQKASDATAWIVRPQNRIGSVGLIVMLTLTNTIIPFTTDMYTPAMPSLPGYFGTNEATVNMTIVLFFLMMTLSVLGFGPVSDRFGRKPVLVGGLAVYVVGCMSCAVAWSITSLIAFRILQGIGAGATVAVSMALVKDSFVEHRREQMLSILQVLGVVGPVAAPLFGGIILSFASWQAIFIALGVLGGASLVLALLFQETLPVEERRTGGVLSTLKGLVEVGRNKSFLVFLVISSSFSLPFMAYVTAASYIYVDFFGNTPQVYTYYFAFTAAISMFGPLIYLRAAKFMSPRMFTHILLGTALASGVLIAVIGWQSAIFFCVSFAIFAVCTNAARPYMTNILLAQNEHNAGSASSLINFMYNILGVVGMTVINLPWSNYVSGVAIITITCMAIMVLLWVFLLKSSKLHIPEFDK